MIGVPTPTQSTPSSPGGSSAWASRATGVNRTSYNETVPVCHASSKTKLKALASLRHFDSMTTRLVDKYSFYSWAKEYRTRGFGTVTVPVYRLHLRISYR